MGLDNDLCIQIGPFLTSPWLLLGDYNQVLLDSNKRGGSGRWKSQAFGLWETIEKCQLLELGFSGPAFTWTNGGRVASISLKGWTED